MRALARCWMLVPALLVTVFLFGGGLFFGLLQALGKRGLFDDAPATFRSFYQVLTDPDFRESLVLTLYVSAMSTLIAAAAAVGAALVLTELVGKHRALRFIFQTPLVVPHLAVAISFLFLLSPTGLISRAATSAGLISGSGQFPLLVNDRWCISILAVYVWKEIPFITMMLVAVLHNRGLELSEAGKTLGAGPVKRFFHITLPILTPALAGASLIVFAYTFGAFEVPFLLGRTYPMMLPVQAWRYFSDVDLAARPEGIATGLLIAGIVVILTAASRLAAGLFGGRR